ncbi:MAG TPA: sn-glycerol-3-phosphate ABC transporter ATP-binding protein UgpC, partial [Gaiellaceae bacterium]|nr:sn-glycerol-3-phosphate ABC transporter ATP-binding protein UgpC [Gaiellaceae bacterium]
EPPLAQVALDEVSKIYPGGTVAVDELSLDIRDGEFMVLVGPSGCGKSTGLKMVAGLEGVSRGTIAIGDRVVNDLPPKDRDVARIFQNYALYPHMDAYANMAFALKMRGLAKAEIDRRVREAARVLGLADVLRKKPRTLSGGQRQRVAMGRAIVREPQAFLMDEPLSNLDAKLRVQMRAEIARIQRDLSVTTIYVTHDQSEAMTLGDRVAVMRRGELQQLAAPQTLYRKPVNLFVAEFIGSPAMNLVEAEIADGKARFGEHTLPVDGRPGLDAYESRTVALGIRPEDFEDAALLEAPAERRLPVTVDLREDMGSEIFLHFSVAAPLVATEIVKEAVEAEGGVEALPASRGTPFVARVGRESPAREDDRIELAVDTRMLHFFDLETGEAIAQ